jgi:hypothetical protein
VRLSDHPSAWLMVVPPDTRPQANRAEKPHGLFWHSGWLVAERDRRQLVVETSPGRRSIADRRVDPEVSTGDFVRAAR